MALALMVPVVEAQTQQEIDPWEGYNRWMFDFNGDTDRLIIRPVAKGYDAIMPEFGRIGVNNFFSNFYDFNGALKRAVAGPNRAGGEQHVPRVANSTIGLFGLFDVASMAASRVTRPILATRSRSGACPAAISWCCRSSGRAPCAPPLARVLMPTCRPPVR